MLQKSLVDSTPILTERDMLVALAKRWPGHAGVNFETTASGDIYLLISDALNLELPHEPLAPWVHQLLTSAWTSAKTPSASTASMRTPALRSTRSAPRCSARRKPAHHHRQPLEGRPSRRG
jgi:hypothetical protein